MTLAAAQPAIPPVVKSIIVARSIEDAFRLYTAEIGKWWPSHTHSLGEDKVASVIMEARAGGRIFERWHDGTEKLWGTVLDCQAPHRIVSFIHGTCRRTLSMHRRLSFGLSRFRLRVRA